MPVPTVRHTSTSTPSAAPSACSPTAHRFASFSTTRSEPAAHRRSASACSSPGRSRPGRFGARCTVPARASGMPGVPTTVATTSPGASPAKVTADATAGLAVRTRALPERHRFGSSGRATTLPSRSATATRIERRPMSTPTMWPASGATRYTTAARPGPDGLRPVARTNPHCSRSSSACPTVGFESPVSVAIPGSCGLPAGAQPVEHQPLVQLAHVRRCAHPRPRHVPATAAPFPQRY